jgi:hypothetical protein
MNALKLDTTTLRFRVDRLFAAAKDEVGGQFGGQDPSGTDEPGSLAGGTGL